MSEAVNFPIPPPLVISQSDHRALSALIDSPQAGIAHEDLQTEIDRARIVPDEAAPADAVRMGSFVRFRADEGQERSVQLVWPQEADIEAGRISVLTPVGTALIGLGAGRSIAWTARGGKRHSLTVLEVRQTPPGAETGPDAA